MIKIIRILTQHATGLVTTATANNLNLRCTKIRRYTLIKFNDVDEARSRWPRWKVTGRRGISPLCRHASHIRDGVMAAFGPVPHFTRPPTSIRCSAETRPSTLLEGWVEVWHRTAPWTTVPGTTPRITGSRQLLLRWYVQPLCCFVVTPFPLDVVYAHTDLSHVFLVESVDRVNAIPTSSSSGLSPLRFVLPVSPYFGTAPTSPTSSSH